MIDARIDTPWIALSAEEGGGYGTKLEQDFGDRILAMADRTGNYPEGHPSGGGQPDYLMVNMITEDENLVGEIDALPEYYVYSSVRIMFVEGTPVVIDNSWSALYRYITGTGNYQPGQGELFYRSNQDIVRISKHSLITDVEDMLATLTEFDRLSVGPEEFFELRGQVRDRGLYIEWDIADMQQGPGGTVLPEADHTFTFMPNDQKRRPDHRPSNTDWNEMRAKLNGRGYPPGWVDRNLGTDRNRLRAEHEESIRSGYATDRA